MGIRRLLKLNARRALRGRWGQAAAVALMVLAISFLFNLFEGVLNATLDIAPFEDLLMTPDNLFDDTANTSTPALLVAFAAAALSFVILTPLGFGVQRWFYRIGEGVSEEISTAFEFFGSARIYLRSLGLSCSLWIRGALWSGLFLLPGLLLIFFSVMVGEQSSSNREAFAAVTGILAGCFLAVLGMLFSMIWCARYYLARYYLIEDTRLPVRRAVRRSILATKGHQIDIVLFEASFVGWRLLCLLIFPILFVYPYYQTAKGLYARYLIAAAEQPAAPARTPVREGTDRPAQSQYEHGRD